MNIEPYQSLDSLRFGESTREDCVTLHGKPNSIRENREGVEEYHYDEFIVRFDLRTNTLHECTLLPKATARIRDLEVTWDQEFLRKACEQDGHPMEVYGFIVMRKLGLAVTGIHDGDSSQVAITAVSKGECDDLMSEALPFDLSSIQ